MIGQTQTDGRLIATVTGTTEWGEIIVAVAYVGDAEPIYIQKMFPEQFMKGMWKWQ